MNVLRLNDILSNRPDYITQILESIGFSQIRFDSSKNTVRFPRQLGSNPTSMVLNCQNLMYKCFSTNASGNIYTLVMDARGCSFPNALRHICNLLNIEKSIVNFHTTPPFGGFYKRIAKSGSTGEVPLVTYPDSTLDSYLKLSNSMFIKDGIDAKTQELFNVGYDMDTNRITIPQYTIDGKLCGIMGRLNDSQCPHEDRWFPVISCQRSLTLYGFHINYHDIVDKKTIILGESEKFVQQCYSFGCHVALATCGCHISDTQAKYIKSLMPKRVIIAYDEGLDEEFLQAQAKKILTNDSIVSIKVGYVLDESNELIRVGSKMNAADLGRAGFTEAIKSKVKYIN